MPKRALLALIAAVAALALAACGSSTSTSGTSADTATPTASVSPTTISSTIYPSPSSSPKTAGPTGTAQSANVTCSYPASGTAARPVTPPPAKPTVGGKVAVTLTTTEGAIPLTLDAASAPCTVNSFVSLAEQSYFNNTPCHRLTTSGIFVLQCGDPTGTGTGGPGYSFADELTSATKLVTDAAATAQAGGQTTYKIYPAGTLAMANSGPNTNGSQFFLVYQDSTLPPAYTVFGKISASGMATLTKIAAAGQDNSNAQGDGHPNDGVKITAVTWK